MRASPLGAFAALAGVLVAAAPAASQTPSPPTAAASQTIGTSPADLVRRAFDANRELAAARLDLERGRARLQQAGLRPNPTLDVEQITGWFTGDDERARSVGLALPIEFAAKRQRRIDVATAELAVVEAEIVNRERQLARDVLAAYVDAIGALRARDTTQRLQDLNEQMLRVVRTRVEEQDAPPLELSLLQTEVARLQSRRALIQGRVEAALLAIQHLIGSAPTDTLTLEPSAATLDVFQVPSTLDLVMATALERRADVSAARLNEQAAEAGVRLAGAEALPDVTVSGTYTASRGVTELPRPLVAVADDDKVLAFGASIGLPFFNKNQGARAEAAVAVRQARLRREAMEHTVRVEVASAFRRAEAARAAVVLLEQGVLDRSADNIRVMRAAYELGEFRITDVITEQRRLLEAQQEYTDALAERYRALIDLRAAVGLIGLQP